MLVDAASCMFSGLVGTSTAGVYIESATGIRDGARTGLAAVTTGLLFLASLFFIPLVEPLQSLRYAYAPALVVVGLLMLGSVRHIAYDDMTELVPAFATIALDRLHLQHRERPDRGARLPSGCQGCRGPRGRGPAGGLGAGRDVVSLLWFRASPLTSPPAFNGMDLASRASAPTRRS